MLSKHLRLNQYEILAYVLSLLLSTWWARQIRSRSWRLRNLLTTSAPKVKETPRSFSPQPCTSLSGSDHSRSHSRPERHTARGKTKRADEEQAQIKQERVQSRKRTSKGGIKSSADAIVINERKRLGIFIQRLTLRCYTKEIISREK